MVCYFNCQTPVWRYFDVWSQKNIEKRHLDLFGKVCFCLIFVFLVSKNWKRRGNKKKLKEIKDQKTKKGFQKC
jgi:hypothetical protein